MSIDVKRLRIKGLFSIQPVIYGDTRGYFFETYNKRDFVREEISACFVQDNQSKSSLGVLRGLHFQKTHPQGKLVRVISGRVFDVAVDLRAGSSTFGQWEGIILSGELQNQFYISPGFAHGFLVLSEEAVFAYKCTDFYHPEDEGGIKWDDPIIGIEWPEVGIMPRLSEKDLVLPFFDPATIYYNGDNRPELLQKVVEYE